MRFKQLSLENFRHLAHFETTLDERLTVLVARNGQGKTTVLDALAVLLGSFVGAFDMGKSRHIERSDARYRRQGENAEQEQQYPVRIAATLAELEGQTIRIARELTGPKNRTTVKDAVPLAEHGKALMQQVRDLEPVTLPLMSYYGTGRLWRTHKNLKRKAVLSESRTLGYEDCLTSSSNYLQLQEWMGKATLAVLQQKERKLDVPSRLEGQLNAVLRAVDKVLEAEGWSGIHYSLTYEELAMQQQGQGILPVSLLSDGVRTMVSMVADMAWRCAKLNPHLNADAAKETPGIVLIDEIDLHLHPAWQQRVIQSLVSTFPKVQFIVTTHSPQVLTTVSRECIRLIDTRWDEERQDWARVSIEPDFQTRGVSSVETLSRIMGIFPVPDVKEARLLDDYRQMIEQGQEESQPAQDLYTQLIAHFGESHPVMIECERLRRFQSMKRRMKGRESASDA
ncbi:Predicted ATP-binding protein involved in virulence [Modicisalibacter ilicicola DSM 19980]|uniref:Predicted ATP-binding protein involved in virulence n=1 Tax=Modicisalibacter ilicicola DSM 19980 TaxID=1121942 RepID=A0A1M4W2P7_9GAMM|nr:AAA family ATPase [Halomonas ilicicola]SHE75242.1 Predicted ATP-binding protein involved in virulence [Halomonas ilicicola DSM 19980]